MQKNEPMLEADEPQNGPRRNKYQQLTTSCFSVCPYGLSHREWAWNLGFQATSREVMVHVWQVL